MNVTRAPNFGHMIQRADSLEKTLMLEKTEDLVHMELPECLAFCIQALMVLLAKCLWQGCNLHTPVLWHTVGLQ